MTDPAIRSENEKNRDAAAVIEAELERLHTAREEVARAVVGQDDAIEQLFVSLLGGGHTLVEGAPGLGKTLLVRTVATVCGLRQTRIQFTPDLMPADITGTMALLKDGDGSSIIRFQPGPIFAQLVLADEINRATPKTQSALLEAMQERTVTVAGKEYELPSPFFVLATQNPIEMEGTYLLPEAQIDRFFLKVMIPFPGSETFDGILALTTGTEQVVPQKVMEPEHILRLQTLTREVPIASNVRKQVVRFIMATQPDSAEADTDVKRYARFGVSPRGGQALILAAKAHALLSGRYNVSFDDVRAVAIPALRHRFPMNYEGEAEGVSGEALLSRLLERTLSSTR